MAVGYEDGSGGAAAGDEAPPSAAELRHYETFHRRLQADLAAARALRESLMEEEQQYAELEQNLELLQREQLTSLTTLVPLGAGVHAQAAVPDTSRIFMHVALGFHPELTLEEARAAAAQRRQHLRSQVEARGGEVAGILAHLRLVQQALSDLADLQGQGQEQQQQQQQGGRQWAWQGAHDGAAAR